MDSVVICSPVENLEIAFQIGADFREEFSMPLNFGQYSEFPPKTPRGWGPSNIST